MGTDTGPSQNLTWCRYLTVSLGSPSGYGVDWARICLSLAG